MDISKHPLLRQCHELTQAIEICGASPELTAAVCKAGELMKGIDALVSAAAGSLLTREISQRHARTTMVKFFAYEHLPYHLKVISRPVGELAELMESELPPGPEKSAGMRKLLEAKDCFVRAALP